MYKLTLSSYYLWFLLFIGVNNSSFSKSTNFVFQITPGVGITGSAFSTNTLFFIGLKKHKTSNILAFKYTYIEKNSGGFFDRHNVYKLWERGILFIRGFYNTKKIIFLGAGLSYLKKNYHIKQKAVKVLSFPLEIHFIYPFSPVVGIGMNLYASLNKEQSYFGAGLNISFGKLY